MTKSTVYFAAAGLLIFVACLGAGRRLHRHMRPKLFATLVAVSLMTFLLIWLLLIALTRKEADLPHPPPDYSTPSGTG
jgi:predicted PurR-regulated permease PerM